jgi:hypothetical protein
LGDFDDMTTVGTFRISFKGFYRKLLLFISATCHTYKNAKFDGGNDMVLNDLLRGLIIVEPFYRNK